MLVVRIVKFDREAFGQKEILFLQENSHLLSNKAQRALISGIIIRPNISFVH